jgi:hypothetical protein
MTINDMIDNDGVQDRQPPISYEEDAQPVQQGFAIPEFLKARTGAGSVESYINHPLNFNESKPVARILRGLTGMFNELDYAVVDIVLGVLGMSKKAPVAQ